MSAYLAPPFPVINGVSFFPSYQQPLHWFYLPVAPRLATTLDPATGIEVPRVQLIAVKGEDGTGGFLNFDVTCGVTPEELDDLRDELRRVMRLDGPPTITPLPLVDGTVRLMLLDRETGQAGGPATGPRFVERISHEAHPTLYGGNEAAFSVQLTQQGVTAIEQAMQGELSPIGVVYSLEFLAMRPAYAVQLKVDWDRVQDHFDRRFGVDTVFTSIQIDEAIDELVENRTISLEADTFIPEDEQDEKAVLARRDHAIAEVRDMLTDAFFQPTINPTTPAKDGWDRVVDLANAASRLAVTGGWSAIGSFTYKQSHYTRIDRKTLNVQMSERTTVRRRIFPQGHLSGLFHVLREPGIDLDRFVLRVDTSDAWFDRRRLRVVPRADFEREGIESIDVRLRYAKRQPRNLVFGPDTGPQEIEWSSVVRDGAMVPDVSVDFRVNLAAVPGVDRPASISSTPEVVTNDVWEVFTRRLYDVVPVAISALDVPWDRFPQVQVRLGYRDDAHGIVADDTIVLDVDNPERMWPLFIADGGPEEFTYQVTYCAANLRDEVRPEVVTDDPIVTIRNPFPAARRRVLEIVPAVDWDLVDQVFVDCLYEHEDVREEASLVFDADNRAPQQFGVDLVDPAERLVSYRVTIIRADGEVIEVPESQTLERRIFVRMGTFGHRIVPVRPAPVDFARRGVKHVAVKLRYEDDAEGIAFADEFVFDSADDRATFEFDYVDRSRRAEYLATTTFLNGMETEGDWTRSTDDEVVVPIGVAS
jgi:hypothetical protein